MKKQVGISDIVDAASSIAGNIQDFFTNTGKYAVEIINGGLSAFQHFINFSIELLTVPIDDKSQFGDFWTIIDKVTAVFGVIASTVIVLLFLINMCTDTWDNRHDLDMWEIVKMIVKMIVSVVLVNNALLIVKSIFIMGSNLANVITINGIDKTLELSGSQQELIITGVTGFKGVIAFLLFAIGAGVIVACGVQIAMEIYQRIFKIYVLIPFSTIAFTTFVMGNGNRGNEVFKGYIKNIISTAFEAIIIVICVAFAYSIMGNANIMEKLLGTDETAIDCVELTVNNKEEAMMLLFYLDKGDVDSVNGEHQNIIDGWKSKLYGDSGRSDVEYGAIIVQSKSSHGLGNTTKLSGKSFLNTSVSLGDIDYPAKVYVYPEITWKNLLLIILSVVFPCVLCTGAIKAAGQYSGLIFGR